MIEVLTELSGSHPTFFCILSMGCSVLFSVLFIPSLPITTMNIVAFGPVWGGILSFFGELCAAFVTYELYRWGWIKTSEKLPRVKALHSLRASTGLMSGFFQVVILRLIPFFPSSGVTVYALYKKIGRSSYMWGSMIGKLPAMMIEVLSSFGITILFMEQLNEVFLVLFAGCLVIFLFKKLLDKQKSKNHNQSDDTK